MSTLMIGLLRSSVAALAGSGSLSATVALWAAGTVTLLVLTISATVGFIQGVHRDGWSYAFRHTMAMILLADLIAFLLPIGDDRLLLLIGFHDAWLQFSYAFNLIVGESLALGMEALDGNELVGIYD